MHLDRATSQKKKKKQFPGVTSYGLQWKNASFVLSNVPSWFITRCLQVFTAGEMDNLIFSKKLYSHESHPYNSKVRHWWPRHARIFSRKNRAWRKGSKAWYRALALEKFFRTDLCSLSTRKCCKKKTYEHMSKYMTVCCFWQAIFERRETDFFSAVFSLLIRNLTIWQRGSHYKKRHWKTFPLSFWKFELELKTKNRNRAQKDRVKIIALPWPSSKGIL